MKDLFTDAVWIAGMLIMSALAAMIVTAAVLAIAKVVRGNK